MSKFTPRKLSKGGVQYYSAIYEFRKLGSRRDVRFYVRTDNKEPLKALNEKAEHYAWSWNMTLKGRIKEAWEYVQ